MSFTSVRWLSWFQFPQIVHYEFMQRSGGHFVSIKSTFVGWTNNPRESIFSRRSFQEIVNIVNSQCVIGFHYTSRQEKSFVTFTFNFGGWLCLYDRKQKSIQLIGFLRTLQLILKRPACCFFCCYCRWCCGWCMASSWEWCALDCDQKNHFMKCLLSRF